jgi:arylsulfatase A-like enzyme
MTYGFNETIDTGGGGLENADVIFEEARRWLSHRAKEDNWFLHLNLWDPHTPYDTPASFGNPFAEDPIDSWVTQEIIEKQRASFGPHSAREVPHYDSKIDPKVWPWGRGEIISLGDAKVHIDGYDCGVRYADEYIGRIVNILSDAGVLENTAIIVAADHGENLGELNVWGDHQTADEFTNRIPGIVSWPGVTSPASVVNGFHYHLDLASTIVDLASPKGQEELAKAEWEGVSMAAALKSGNGGRGKLFLSQGAWSLQRSARWDDWILIHTVDTGMKDFSKWMLFDLKTDPHETQNVAQMHPQIVNAIGAEMQSHFQEMSKQCPIGDPFKVVQSEGGPYHAKVNGHERGPYLTRLRNTGRKAHADWLETNGNQPRPIDVAAY